MANLNGVLIELSQAQLQIIRNEIDGDSQYNDKSNGTIVKILNDKAMIDNPIPRGKIQGQKITPEDVAENSGLTYTEIKGIVLNTEGARIWDDLKSRVAIDTSSRLFGQYVDRLGPSELSLISQERVDSLKKAGEIDDPDYQDKITGNSRAETILGGTGDIPLPNPAIGIMLEGSDIAAAKALP